MTDRTISIDQVVEAAKSQFGLKTKTLGGKTSEHLHARHATVAVARLMEINDADIEKAVGTTGGYMTTQFDSARTKFHNNETFQEAVVEMATTLDIPAERLIEL